MNPESKRALSWLELLVIIAIIGVLTAVLIPSRSSHWETTTRLVDASNLRQIGQSALIYAYDNDGRLPGMNLTQLGEIEEGAVTPNLHAIAAALARHGGLNDCMIWVSSEDRHPGVNPKLVGPILSFESPRVLSPEFSQSALSVQFIAGLRTEMPSATPLAFTRGLQPDGRWANEATVSVYGNQGGYIVFLGGNVTIYREVARAGGELKTLDGRATSNILEAIGSNQRIFSRPATPTGAVDGVPGIGELHSKAK